MREAKKLDVSAILAELKVDKRTAEFCAVLAETFYDDFDQTILEATCAKAENPKAMQELIVSVLEAAGKDIARGIREAFLLGGVK